MHGPSADIAALATSVQAQRARARRAGIATGALVFCAVALGVAALCALELRAERRALQAEAERSALVVTELAHQRLALEIARATDDVRYLSRLPALEAMRLDPTRRAQAAQAVLAFASAEPAYQQVRFLDARGREVIRAERRSGRTHLVPTAQLQDKSHRGYFREANRLGPGQVHVTELDLNVEHGEVEWPLRPTVRLAAPVFDPSGKRQGVVVLNFEGQQLLKTVRGVDTHVATQTWLLDRSGYWLLGPTPGHAWGALLPSRAHLSFATAHPRAWRAIAHSNARSGAMQSDSHILRWRVVTLRDLADLDPERRASLAGSAGEPRMYIVGAVRGAWIERELSPERQRLAIASAVVLLLGAAAALWAGRNVARSAATRRAIAERERLFRVLMSAAPDAILVVREDGRIAMANPRASELFGLPVEQLRGRAMGEFLPGRLSSDGAELLLDLEGDPRDAGPGRIPHGERSDGSRFPCSVVARAVRYEDEHLLLCSVRDVTHEERTREMERLNLALRQTNAALEATISELNTFNHSVAHDLRGPLRGINGLSAALLEDFADELPAQARTYLERIRKGATRMGEMIDGLLSLPRVAAKDVARSDVDIGELAREALRPLRAAEPERQVELQVSGDLRASADPRLLSVVMQNLIGNAWKFSRGVSPAHIEVGRQPTEIGEAFFVRDDGAGFDPRFAEKLFGAFQRLHTAEQFEGTGIGLATAKRIIDKHGGRIWATGKPGEGATVYFTLRESGCQT